MGNFKVGDPVKLVQLDIRWNGFVPSMRYLLGMTGVIKPNELLDRMIWGKDILRVQFDKEIFAVKPEWLELVKKAEKWPEKIVVISVNPDSDFSHAFTKGKAYPIDESHRLKDDTPIEWSGYDTFQDLLDRLKSFGIEAIEFKGYANEGKDTDG